MKRQILLGVLGWSMLGIAACDRHDLATSTTQADELGVCGANADPTTGVVCKSSFFISGGPFFKSSETFDKDGVDFARCTWRVDCDANADPRSLANESCLSVIGTGCLARSETTLFTVELKLPPGTKDDGVDSLCRNAQPTDRTARAACTALDSTVEQGEDQCCLPRKPPPADAGVGLDGGGGGLDATVTVDAGAGFDAGAGGGFDAGAGFDAGGFDAGSGFDAGGFDAGSGFDAGGFDAGSGFDAGAGSGSGRTRMAP